MYTHTYIGERSIAAHRVSATTDLLMSQVHKYVVIVLYNLDIFSCSSLVRSHFYKCMVTAHHDWWDARCPVV